MDPVDQEIGEHEEQRELQHVVEHEGCLFEGVVHLSITLDFSKKEWHGQSSHDR